MKNVLKNILLILDKKEKKQFFNLMALDIIVSVFDILFLAWLLLLIQFYIQPATTGKLYFLPAWLTNRNSAWLISIFLLLFSIKNLCAFLINRSNYAFINRVSTRISCSNLVNYQHAAFSDFTGIDSSVYIRNIHHQPLEFAQYMLAGFQQLVTQLALMLLTIIAILLFNAKIFLLLLLLLLPPVIIVFWFIKKRLSLTKKNIQQNNELSFKYMLDALKGYVESNVYNRNAFFLNRFTGARQKFSKAVFDSMSMQSLPSRIIEIFAVLGLYILIVTATWAGGNNNSMLITVGAFMAAAYKIIPGIVKLINVSGQMKAYQFSLEASALGKINTAIREEQYAKEAIHTIELKNIVFAYAGQPVIQQFSMAINKADFIGITAESGKGKTTLMNVLLGFLQAEQGEIYYNGKAVNSEEIRKYWPSIAYVKQQCFFIHDSLLRNITLQEDDYDPQRLEYALQISGLQKLIKQWPEGINKIITENGKNISGGQQQRICIARALYKNASLLLLDEPFNELDEASTEIMLLYFKELAASGKSVVMITHDKKSLEYCNKIISLDAC